jgi:hypothetical protein
MPVTRPIQGTEIPDGLGIQCAQLAPLYLTLEVPSSPSSAVTALRVHVRKAAAARGTREDVDSHASDRRMFLEDVVQRFGMMS